MSGRARRSVRVGAILVVAGFFASCSGGIEPPDEPPIGAITGTIDYVTPPGDWPAQIQDLRYVALRFVPRDTADFLQLNLMVFSSGLNRRVERDSFLIGDVDEGIFPYSGVAYQRSRDIFDWVPIGLYDENDGIMEVRAGETTRVHVVVDFDNPPPFPP